NASKPFVYRPGGSPDGVEMKPETDPPPSGWLTALDSDTGKVKWKYHSKVPIVAGVTATASGIVLTGDTAGNFLVFDSASGEIVYKKDTGGGIAGGVITYSIGGKQYVALTSGNGSRTFFGKVGTPSLLLLALNETTRRAALASGTPTARLAHGRRLYAENC